jgi:hypothetical protein
MVITFKDIQKVKFPVYALPSDNWGEADGLLFLDGKLIDDRNMPGDTLGVRRLQSPQRSFGKLNKSIDNFRGLIKSSGRHFIDTHGIPFTYEKTIFRKLKYYKIKCVVKRDTFCLLKLHRVKQPFIVPRPPPEGVRYAGLLHLGELPWILYDYSEEPLKDTRRKV